MKRLCLLLVCYYTTAYGQTIATDRPDQTEASSTVPNHSLQIESGILLQFNDNSTGKYRNLQAPTSLFRYGICHWLELRVLNQFESNKFNTIKSEGISDLEVGTKIQLLRPELDRSLEIAFMSHLVLPTGNESLTGKQYGSICKLCISHNINSNSSLGYNIGYNYLIHGKGDFTYSLAYGMGITSKVGVYIEPYGQISELKIHESNFDAGFTYLLKPNIQFDFSFGAGINHKMNYVSTGLSWLIWDKKKYGPVIEPIRS